MIYKLKHEQFNYLKEHLFKAREDIQLKCHVSQNPRYFFIETDDETADEIRDWANDEVVAIGLDYNQEKLNSTGRILEDIADAFFS